MIAPNPVAGNIILNPSIPPDKQLTPSRLD
jgi:hypothetical protein